MSDRGSHRFTLRGWLGMLFRQPPHGLYHTPAIYRSGNQMEIEHFEKILAYDENKLCLQFSRGQLTIYGDELHIRALTRPRIPLYGRFIRTDYVDL